MTLVERKSIMGIMRVVLDTNVFVAGAFKPKSASGEILEMVTSGDLEMVWHVETKEETKFIVTKIPPTRRMWNAYEKLFRDTSEERSKLDEQDLQFIEDPDDRKFFALAKMTGAVLVTNDDHLLTHKDHADVSIMTTGEFMKSLS